MRPIAKRTLQLFCYPLAIILFGSAYNYYNRSNRKYRYEVEQDVRRMLLERQRSIERAQEDA